MNPTFFPSPSEFRKWLEKNHAEARELLLGFHRKDSGKPSITYPEALDQALCFGWIDGIRRRFDPSSYTIRFTPRKPGSIWSAVNTKRAGELMKQERMHAWGQKVFDERDQKKSELYSYERQNCKFEGALEKKFRANKKAWQFYQAQAPWYRRTCCWWVISARQEETRLRHLAQLIQDSAQGRRIKQLTVKPPPGRKR
ncbi:MAG: YdeI/OmpD-associated family protein [Candidatus Korobacteraceae bacterium]